MSRQRTVGIVRGTMAASATIAAVLILGSAAMDDVPSHLLAASPDLRPHRFGRPWTHNTDVPVRYHIAILYDWIDNDDFEKKEMLNDVRQNVAMYVTMFETNTEWNVTRIHKLEFSKLIKNVFDLVIEVGVGLSLESKNSLPYTPRFVRVMLGNEYFLDQAIFIHDTYKIASDRYYSHPDRLWIKPDVKYSSTYLAAMYNTTVQVAPFIWYFDIGTCVTLQI